MSRSRPIRWRLIAGSAGGAVAVVVAALIGLNLPLSGISASTRAADAEKAPTTTTTRAVADDPTDPDAPPGPSTTAAPTGPAFVTLLIGRGEWTATQGCAPLPGAVPLDRVAQDLAARQIRATVGVVPTAVGDTRTCDDGFALRSSWADLAAFRDRFGWTTIPRSSGDLATMDAEKQQAETCGARTALEQRGFDRAWGLFAYANNARDDKVQKSLVSTCFAFGRRYGNGVSTQARMAPPWWQSTRSANGGRCAEESLPCHTAETSKDTVYEGPDDVGNAFQTAPGEWRTVQFYRFVEGANRVGAQTFDCTSPDWRAHWTSRAELYCYNDFVAALSHIPPGATVTDPATVAEAWNRRP